MSQTFHERRGAHRPPGLGPAGAVPWLVAAVAVVLIVVWATGWWGGGGTDEASSNTGVTSGATGTTTKGTSTKSSSSTKTASPTSTKSASTTQTPTVDHSQPVAVLNATKRGGLAAGAATKLRNAGWTIRSTGNYTGSVTGTTIFYGKGSLQATAQAVADDLGSPAAVQESADFGSSRVTAVLGADYPS
ncbi:LytR C-terminal domain-containing protein [Angustibacter luteus]|uniref:LytR C-terminal domain-containing protein n=1 Tax=Angustibacter luteus TaxID=658456 RepID=A0ABW1JCL3_9ACTN